MKQVHADVVNQVCEHLVRSGIPSTRIVREKWILQNGHERYCADIAVLKEDCRCVDAVYEIKVHGGKRPDVIAGVCRNMRFVMDFCKCYLVSLDGADVVVVRLLSDGFVPEWKKLCETIPVETCVPAKIDMACNNDPDPYRWWIVLGGLAMVGLCAWGEWFGHEFSWKMYALLLVVIAVFAAASNYQFAMKASTSGCELTVGGDAPKKGDEA